MGIRYRTASFPRHVLTLQQLCGWLDVRPLYLSGCVILEDDRKTVVKYSIPGREGGEA